jgi:hypothetical protein
MLFRFAKARLEQPEILVVEAHLGDWDEERHYAVV